MTSNVNDTQFTQCLEICSPTLVHNLKFTFTIILKIYEIIFMSLVYAKNVAKHDFFLPAENIQNPEHKIHVFLISTCKLHTQTYGQEALPPVLKVKQRLLCSKQEVLLLQQLQAIILAQKHVAALALSKLVLQSFQMSVYKGFQFRSVTTPSISLSVLQQRHIRNYYNHTHLDHHKCSFFATFWTSQSNLTLNSTLLTNYCKHSIYSSLQGNGIFPLFSNIPFSLTRTSQKASLIHHTYINIPF